MSSLHCVKLVKPGDQRMKCTVFGASGSIGKQIVKQALDKGHTVTAFVRTPERFHIQHPNLSLVTGDVLTDLDKVRVAIIGRDAVLISLGAGVRGKVRSQGTGNIVSAMELLGVQRLICQSTLGAGDSVNALNFKWRMLFALPLRAAMADHEQQERVVSNSNLDWTIVRPSAFTDDPMTKNYHHNFSPTIKGLDLSISRADVAHFMILELETRGYVHNRVSLSN